MAEMPIHRVVILAYPDAQTLDVVGPLEVFARSDRWLKDNGHSKTAAYKIQLIAPVAGPVMMSSGLQVISECSYKDVDSTDTLIVSGGLGYAAIARDPDVIAWLKGMETSSKRIVSICTGAFILARAGLLDGRAATTHWNYCSELSKKHPAVKVRSDEIFVRQGKIYTSAGVTAGMDLALALVEEDWGRAVALAVAQELVMFMKRPGGQSQFSNILAAQHSSSERFKELMVWIQTHPGASLEVERLADKIGMSPRNFARMFAEEIGETPGKYVQRVRVEAARRDLEDSRYDMERIAVRCGFGSAEVMRRSFIKLLSVSPSDYRRRFQSTVDKQINESPLPD